MPRVRCVGECNGVPRSPSCPGAFILSFLAVACNARLCAVLVFRAALCVRVRARAYSAASGGEFARAMRPRYAHHASPHPPPTPCEHPAHLQKIVKGSVRLFRLVLRPRLAALARLPFG